jgi:hypothetical protein
MHSYLVIVWCAVYFGHQPCGISRTNCQGQSWSKLCNVCRTNCQNKLLMFAGNIYLLAVTLCSSFVHFGRWARLAAFQLSRGPLDHTRKWFHWKIAVRLAWPVNPVPGLMAYSFGFNSWCERNRSGRAMACSACGEVAFPVKWFPTSTFLTGGIFLRGYSSCPTL